MTTASVVIVTYGRPICVHDNIACLLKQEPLPDQIIVVDSSPDDKTAKVVKEYPTVLYLRNELGLGHTTESRNIALHHVTSEIIAFLDDDAYVRPGWLKALTDAFSDPRVAGVAGRALNGQRNEESTGADRVGRLTRNGEVLGFFAVDTGHIVEVDHAIGCNMALRTEALARCGGFREGFSGRYCFREESDVFLVMKRLGYKVVFQPAAIVDHIAGPKPKGARFDVTYVYYAQRNHYVLLVRNYGLFAPIIWRYLAVSMTQAVADFLKWIASAFARLAVFLIGTAVGLASGTIWRIRQGRNPVRHDAEGKALSAILLAEDTEPKIKRTNLRQEQPII